jgi:transcriptional regulator with XRE-family HTH domain
MEQKSKGNVDPEYLLKVRQIIGSWIKEMRDQKGLSQEELAAKMNLDRSTIAKIENGKWNFGIDTVTMFAVHLDFYQFFIPKDSKGDLATQMRDRWKRENEQQ